MNGRNQEQISMEQFPRSRKILECGRNGQAEFVPEAFSFGPFRVAPYARLLERHGAPVSVSSRAFDLLCLLISRPGEVVGKRELMAKTWPNLTVEESSLRFHITQLRRALGDTQGGQRYVVNVPGRGYCFVECVRREALPLKQSHANNATSSPHPAWADWQLAAM